MKKTLKNKIPKYAVGADTINQIAGGVSQMAQAGVQSNQDKVTAGSVITGIGGGAAAGAALGSVVPGIGTIAGAIGGALVGGITGSIGHKGSVDIETGEVTENTGIAGWFGPDMDELRQKGGRIKANLVAKNNSAAIAENYYSQYGENDYSMAAMGGVLPTTMAYLDDGELIRTPHGEIMEIPEEGKPEDSNLAKVPVGTQVLSDKLKVPGTNRTFAEEGKRIMKTKKYGNDKYAQASKMLNDRNAQKAYDELLQKQEEMKKKKGLKKTNKYANGTPFAELNKRMEEQMKASTPKFDVNNEVYRNYGYGTYKPQQQEKAKVNNIPSVLSTVASAGSALAGALSNTREKASTSPRFGYTPKFVPTDYNIDPLLDEINRTNAIARYNQSRISPNTGLGLAYGLQAAANRDRSIMQAYNQKRLYENQNAATNAGIYNDWARYDAADRMRQWDTNEANAATARNIRRKGLSQISTIIPSAIKDYRLQKRDNAMLEMMIPFLSKGMTNEQIQNLLNNLI